MVENNHRSILKEVARTLLPDSAVFGLQALRTRRRNGREYPLSEPWISRLGELEANFWIKNETDWFRIKRGAAFEGRYADEVIETVSSEGGTFLDIGSAQGVYSIFAAKAGAEQVYAIDPDPVSNQALQKNIQLNPDVQGKITSLPIALGRESGNLKLHYDKHGRKAPSLVQTTRFLGDTMNVPVRTVDEMIADGSMKMPRVVKIDAEGAEGLILAGMQQALSSPERPTHLFIEMHGLFLPEFGSNVASEVAKLDALGYIPLTPPTQRNSEFHYHFVPKINSER